MAPVQHLYVLTSAFLVLSIQAYYTREDKSKCPEVKAVRNLDLQQEPLSLLNISGRSEGFRGNPSSIRRNNRTRHLSVGPSDYSYKGFRMLGTWYVVQYYATSEEEVSYKCMRAVLSTPTEGLEVEMNVTYSFLDDPDNDILSGNITWRIPDIARPAHWIHEEDTYEGVYNTYILDSTDGEWCLLLHCAEKPKSPRYLTSLIMGRNTTLPPNVISYLRDKLPRYDIALEYMFPMKQTDCGDPARELHYASGPRKQKHAGRKHPFRHRGRRSRNSKAKRTTSPAP